MSESANTSTRKWSWKIIKIKVFRISIVNKKVEKDILFWSALIWGFIEIVICSSLLNIDSDNNTFYAQNFLNGFCKVNQCKIYAEIGLWYRVFAVILMLFGAVSVSIVIIR